MSDTKKVEYRISFYRPGETRDPVDYDAETPFHAVSIGDEVSDLTFNRMGRLESVGRVTRVVHTVREGEDGDLDDTVLVFTEAI